MQKKGFTLIELLIVTVVIATLMGIVFRLAGVGSDSRARALTIKRMQCLENCLSGYYAAYGSYPPVPLQGRSRDVHAEVDPFNVQDSSDIQGSGLNVLRADAACRAQPVAALFPFNSGMNGSISKLAAACQYYLSGHEKYKTMFGNDLDSRAGSISRRANDSGVANWGGNGDSGGFQVFQFGLMAFLLPRYFFMLDGNTDFYGEKLWDSFNEPPCRLDNGQKWTWDQMCRAMGSGVGNGRGNNEAGMISNITSQAVCARWMPNLDGIVTSGAGPTCFYGVETRAGGDFVYMQVPGFTGDGIEFDELHVHTMNGYGKSSGSGSRYLLNCRTVRDGWHRDFFYYSDPPYQNYRLWSAGPNRKTFPPWYTLEEFSASEVSTIRSWTGDDLVHLTN